MEIISRQELNEKFFMDFSHLIDLRALRYGSMRSKNKWLFEPKLRTERLQLYIMMNNLENEITGYGY